MIPGVFLARRSWPATRATLCGDVLVRETALQREGIVPEVDPDALTRCEGRTLHTDDQQDEVDVLQATWSLVRAGRHREAVGLLCDAGQVGGICALNRPLVNGGVMVLGKGCGCPTRLP